ncbi:MAG: glycosyltransferase family 2 protein [Caldilinea sp.]
MQPFVVSVILNTNRRDDTLACLESLRQNTYPNHHVIVLDNHSTDGSVKAIQTDFPEVEIVELADNRGYAGNNNVGIAAATAMGADWIFVLNEDTILAPDCLERLIEVGVSDSTIGIVGPMVYHHAAPGVIQCAGGMLGPNWDSIMLGRDEPDCGQFPDVRPVEWIMGCGILVRREVIEQVGMIDERYFYFWEETEWCIRAGRAGWKVMHVPQARMWHKGITPNHTPKPSVTYYATRNRLLTLSKHHAPAAVKVRVWGQMVRILTSWSVRPRWRNMAEHRNAMLHGIVDFLRHRWGPMVA